MTRSLRSLPPVALLALAGFAAAQSGPLAPDRAKGALSVTVADCKTWLHKLASPEFGGRGTGQEGFQLAADYVSAHFHQLGLRPGAADQTWYQHVPWGTPKVVGEQTSVAFQRDGKVVLEIPADRLSGTASATMQSEGDVVLLVVAPPPAPERGARGGRMALPEVKGLDQVEVANKVVLVHIKGDDDNRNTAQLARLSVQVALSGKSPAALLFVERDAVTGGLSGGRGGAGRRAGPAAAGRALSPATIAFGGDDLSALLPLLGIDAAVLRGDDVAPKVAPLQAAVKVTVEQQQAPAMNVIGVIPGSDPKLAGEYVVIGSHLDHLGRRGDAFYPGADDDGSGTTGVMAVAQMFAKNPVKPRRSILFVCFSGEESGLIGSDYFVKNCPIPLSSIVAELQMDMIGRDEEENVEGNRGEKAEDNRNTVHLVGTRKLAMALHDLCMAKNETAKLDIEWDQEGMFSRSDHANFAKMGVPIAFFFTGLHRDYHQQTDTPDKIHYEKLLRIATWVYDIAFELAQQDSRPHVDPELWDKYRGRGAETPAAPMAPAKGNDGK